LPLGAVPFALAVLEGGAVADVLRQPLPLLARLVLVHHLPFLGLALLAAEAPDATEVSVHLHAWVTYRANLAWICMLRSSLPSVAFFS